MSNLVVPVQIQMQVKPPEASHNDTARSNNESDSSQFNDILAREVAEKTPAGETNHVENVTKDGTVDETATTSRATGDKERAAGKSNTNSAVTTADNSTGSVDLEESQSLVDQVALTENDAGLGLVQSLSSVGMPVSEDQLTLMQQSAKFVTENNAGFGLVQSLSSVGMPVSEDQLTLMQQSAKFETSVSSSVASPFFPVEMAETLKNQLSAGDKTLASRFDSNAAAIMQTPQYESQRNATQGVLDNNGLWRLQQTVETVDNSRILSLSTEAGQETWIKAGESGMMHADFDVIQQSKQTSLNSASQTLSTLTAQTATPHSMNLDTQIGQPKWNGDFAHKIIWLANQQHQVAELRLNPANLGPVEIMLSLAGDNGTQQAAAQFVSPHQAVREAIEAALPRLREMMAESGIQLGDVMVGSESFQRQEQDGRQRHHLSGNAQNLAGSGAEEKLETHIITNKHNGIVNTFA